MDRILVVNLTLALAFGPGCPEPSGCRVLASKATPVGEFRLAHLARQRAFIFEPGASLGLHPLPDGRQIDSPSGTAGCLNVTARDFDRIRQANPRKLRIVR